MIDFYKKYFQHITIWHLVCLIGFFGIIMSMHNIFDQIMKQPNHVMELINVLENPKKNVKIKEIKPKIVRSIPTLYDLQVKIVDTSYDFIGKEKIIIYNSVSDKIYHKIIDIIAEKSKTDSSYQTILENPQTEPPYFGFGPLVDAIGFILPLISCYLLYSLFKSTTAKFFEQMGDKYIGKKEQGDLASNVTFQNIAGFSEEKIEMQEIIDFLKYPQKYKEMGARIPKGVLLSGPPGTGKTLLAKAVAGEAGVAFFATSGSEFVEKYVGVGASRVRNLFQKASQHAPCIIFIDEVEGLAHKRGARNHHSEHDNTLNQLLVELDGFNSNTEIIVIAATNKPEVLDSAILRPGRFDRRFTINLPSARDRRAILELHAKNKRFSSEVNLSEIAEETIGFSGAQLEGVLNESALLAVRRRSLTIEPQDVNEAIDRILIGSTRKKDFLSKKEKKLVAYHEAGHGVLAVVLDNIEKVRKITIIPRGSAGGYNIISPDSESSNFKSRKKLIINIAISLGGRAAEEIFLDDISNGAYSDFDRASQIARTMVIKYGMSKVGLVQFSESKRDFSDSKASEIDLEVKNIINECYQLAKLTLLENKYFVNNLVKYLLKIETLVTKDIEEIYLTGKLSWFDQEQNENLGYLNDQNDTIETKSNDKNNSDLINNNESSDDSSDTKETSENKDLSKKFNN
ncbi:AAA family ATPase [Candidatus Phytoplasma fabacearum]|uniref:AAA family ATPase n=1 Tax=Candidatus Phytoplasma fabacearum TaxID=2982628 RepID=UPI0027130829|nr:AAA family ATPase ['Bituminaria bituminosa' little leaf phytoplasma]MDV3154217.1 AAA family ATPase [Pigeon pea little leaf phytoplasma]MDO7983643.1 AAA family ATPase ['Bituminaria bituminosa' little leaf phytoplasma]MDO8030452.1 AAA family ATPase ['Bituminaria bituminosa' little leaf phytoplasma]MDV3163471.1 AAA family ATPase [Pigeon pea little leaf phytoplasma]MDV3164492.1 AAA family ATPase [Pigeon pea little leaf phytoplasma]